MIEYIKVGPKRKEPVYVHDCENCTYHGIVCEDTIVRFNLFDVYTHNTTLILRHGNDGPEYLSYPLEMVRANPEPFGAPAQCALKLVQDTE